MALVLETEGRSLAWVGAPIVSQPATGTTLGGAILRNPCPRLVPRQLGEEGTAQYTVGAGGGPGKALALPLPGFRKG